jgi:hypothetical protein
MPSRPRFPTWRQLLAARDGPSNPFDEIATLRRHNDVLRHKLGTLEQIVLGGAGRGLPR